MRQSKKEYTIKFNPDKGPVQDVIVRDTVVYFQGSPELRQQINALPDMMDALEGLLTEFADNPSSGDMCDYPTILKALHAFNKAKRGL